MTDQQLTIIVSGIAPTMAALGTLIAIIMSNFKSTKERKEVKEAVKEVHTIVNNKADVAARKIEGLEKQVAELLARMAEKKETAALLAQAAARHTPSPTEPAPVVVMNTPKEPLPVEDVAGQEQPKKRKPP